MHALISSRPFHYAAGGECGIPTYQHFKMPSQEPQKMWYSFDMGPIHFLQISTELDFAAGSEQNRQVLAHPAIQPDYGAVEHG